MYRCKGHSRPSEINVAWKGCADSNEVTQTKQKWKIKWRRFLIAPGPIGAKAKIAFAFTFVRSGLTLSGSRCTLTHETPGKWQKVSKPVWLCTYKEFSITEKPLFYGQLLYFLIAKYGWRLKGIKWDMDQNVLTVKQRFYWTRSCFSSPNNVG